uniref:Phosphate transporter n=1 Tax=Ditylenchus dipsaci TaxID=166011 RepID=A0A915D1U6_9BILA
MRGMDGLHWDNVIKIVVSWIVSPVLSGLISAVFYLIFDFAVFRRKDSLKSGFQIMPIFILLAIGALAALVFQFVIRGFLVKWVKKEGQIMTTQSAESTTLSDTERNHFQYGTSPNQHPQRPKTLKSFLKWLLPDRKRINDQPTLRLFSAIQVFTGCFTGFSHGSKDIPNTIAPLATLLYVFSSHSVPKPQETSLWILMYGSLGTCVGFWMLGHRVIRTVGKEFTEINPFAGFCVELGAAITVLIASKLGIPISMTLCIVGSVVAVGAVRGSTPVDWLFFEIFLPCDCKQRLLEFFASHDQINTKKCMGLMSRPMFGCNLTRLYFYLSDQLTDDILESLTTYSQQLQHVTIIECPLITDHGVISVTINQKRLGRLELRGLNKLTSQALKFVKSPLLYSVDLSGCSQIGSEGVFYLVFNNPSIRHLCLNHCEV